MAVTSLQEIGGGIARGPSTLESFAERTAVATETLAAKTDETPAPITGGTDITKPSSAPSAMSSPSAPAKDPYTLSNLINSRKSIK
jgi:hypothetical protein